MRRGVVLGILLVAPAVAFIACEEADSIPTQRYYIPPDAATDADFVPEASGQVPDPDAAGVDAATDADASLDGSAGPTGPLLATGSGFHPDLAIGSGDHTCVVSTNATATRSTARSP